MRTKEILKTLSGMAYTALVAGAFGIGMVYMANSNCLKPEDFNNAEWYLVKNDGIIWDDYMNEKIPHNSDNWFVYIEEVRKRNPKAKRLEGDILLPDLDHDGIVGK